MADFPEQTKTPATPPDQPTPPETKAGDRGATAGRDIKGNILITGDNNVIQTGTTTPEHVPEPLEPTAGVRVEIHRLPTTGKFLFGRSRQLARLTTAWNGERTNVISLVAFGGVGKSALVNGWLASMSRNDYRGAGRVYGWSAYSQGSTERVTSADVFIEEALRFFGEVGELSASVEVRAMRLAELVREERTLLILDGIEPLQYPPGPGEGHIKDPGVRTLVRELAARNRASA